MPPDGKGTAFFRGVVSENIQIAESCQMKIKDPMAACTFIANGGAVFALIDQHGQLMAREIAGRLSIAERLNPLH
jgi:hypothetical protein